MKIKNIDGDFCGEFNVSKEEHKIYNEYTLIMKNQWMSWFHPQSFSAWIYVINRFQTK